MTGIVQDFQVAFRALGRSPGFTIAAVLTLALGSGANTAMFSMFYQALLRPLPVPAADQLVNLTSPGPRSGRTSTSGTARSADIFSYPLFRDLERTQSVFTGLAAHRDFPANVAYDGYASSEEGRLVSGSYFPVLGLRPAVGRLLTPQDDRPGEPHDVVVLSHGFWLSRFGGSASAINETIIVNGQSMTIVGATPAEFLGTTLETHTQFYVPLSTANVMMPGWSGFEDRRDHWLYLFGRLKGGIARERAEQVTNGVFSAILRDVELPLQSALTPESREEFTRRRLILEPGRQGHRPEREELASVFTLLFSVTGVVLLISCANVAGLMLVRAIYRMPEVTIRMSLGASRQRLVRHLLIESSLLSAAGALGGLLVALWTLGMVASLIPQAGAYFRMQLDSTQLFFAVGLSAAIALLIGVYPAFHGTRLNLASTLRASATPSATPATAKFRTVLATTQMALAMGLLVVAILLAKSVFNIGRVELGIEPDRLTTFRLSPELSGYTPGRARLLTDRVEQEIKQLPGVESVSTSTIALLAGMGGGSNINIDAFGTRTASDQGVPRAHVGPDYFKTVGIRLLAGREFSAGDTLGAPKVAIVNESFARQFAQGRNPIGIRLAEGRKTNPDIEVVGFVADARYAQIKESPPPQYFVPHRQSDRFVSLNFYVRSVQPAEEVITMITPAVQRVDTTLPVENLRTMPDQLTSTLGLDRLMMVVSVGFAALAMVLSAIGLYGLLSFMVAQRRREIGIRIAVGADKRQITRLVLARVWRIIVIGSAVGGFIGVSLTQVTRSLLFGIVGQQPLVLAAAAVGTSVIALVAAYIPASRAASVDPLVALRYE
jgi:putative ABC transport system permease protein